MLAATLIAVFTIPALFVTVERLSRGRPRPAAAPAGSLVPSPGDD